MRTLLENLTEGDHGAELSATSPPAVADPRLVFPAGPQVQCMGPLRGASFPAE